MLVILASCQRDAMVSVLGTGSTPEFIVEPDDGTRCISRLLVYGIGNRNQNATASWGIGLIPGRGTGDCRNRVTFGQTPSGYESDIPPTPLAAGKRYRVEASGAGWKSTKDWTPQ